MNKASTSPETTTITTTIEVLNIDNALSQQGHFCLLDWLIAENYLPYHSYEQWRYGDIRFLDKHIKLDKTQLLALAGKTEELCQSLKLQALPEEYFAWSERASPLAASQNKTFNQALTQQWKRPQDLPQMDLFMDNTATIAENALLNALAMRHYQQAQSELEKLTKLNASHEKLGGYQDLINYGYHMEVTNIATEHLNDEIQALQNEVLPLANTLLKHQARDYLAFAWRRLDHNLHTVTFNPQQALVHRSYVLMQIPDWENAAKILSEEPARFAQPTLLLRSAQCYEALHQQHNALLCWCLLIELDSAKSETLIESRVSQLIWRLWQNYWEWEGSEHLDIDYFPAYIIKQHPGLIHHLNEIPDLKSPASQAVIAAIKARQSGEDQIPLRKHLQDIHPQLLAMYLEA